MQSACDSRMNIRALFGVGLPLVGRPHSSFERRLGGEPVDRLTVSRSYLQKAVSLSNGAGPPFYCIAPYRSNRLRIIASGKTDYPLYLPGGLDFRHGFFPLAHACSHERL